MKTEDRLCLCEELKWVIKFSQTAGLFPCKVNHEINNIAGNCKLDVSKKTFSFIRSHIITIIYLLTSLLVATSINDFTSTVFKGTDFFAFSIQLLSVCAQSFEILIWSVRSQNGLQAIWDSSLKIYNRIHLFSRHLLLGSTEKSSNINLQQLREKFGKKCNAMVISLVVQAIIFALLLFHGNDYCTKANSVASCGLLQNVFSTSIALLLILVPWGLTILFSSFCLLLSHHFYWIRDAISFIFARPVSNNFINSVTSKVPWRNSTTETSENLISTEINPSYSTTANLLEELRLCHESLCDLVLIIEEVFGYQILMVLCCAALNISIGLYALILHEKGMPSEFNNEIILLFTLQLGVSSLTLVTALICGQLVINAADSPSKVLFQVPLQYINNFDTQIVIFLNKLACNSTQIKGLNITTISMKFLSSLAVNVTTYFLILMQFKLSAQ